MPLQRTKNDKLGWEQRDYSRSTTRLLGAFSTPLRLAGVTLDVTKKLGVITEFNETTSKAKVLSEGKTIEIHSTIFQSKLPTRFPRQYDLVNLIYTKEGNLISVRQI